MQYPSFVETKLAGSDALQGAVKLSVASFEKWLESSGLPFFPEYTDHSPKHLESVLRTAEALISDEGHNAFTAGDAAILVLAVLLHDSAMHLSEDGFLALIQQENTQVVVSGFGDKPWPQLWEDYMAEASRFDGRKLKSLFGDTEPVHRPAMNPQDMTRRDRLLIGEFLRRHHPRLAHEIALRGVPGPDADRLRLKEVPEDFADLAGVVARSHGLPLRSCLNYLQSKHNNVREYKGVHAVYLMALLRVADYLQIEAERAPKQVLQVRRLRSPYSQREWNAHHAIRDIRNTHEDPEAIYVDAAPADVSTYLKIKELLAGIQGELDASWAVLGEVYGRFLSGLTLTLRRVRSNLDDEATFAKTVNYVPCRAAFETADADLLKLLIGPLYGDKPEIGVRELMQNAVDAVRELEEYRKQRPDLSNIDLTEQEADVIISVDKDADGSHWLTVSDCGIGMTVETVRGYFLKAGASFRRSDAWRQRFENKEGHSQVLRSGRFGVGALAAFLLGDEIHVSTRHVDAPANQAISFHATLDSEAIELHHCHRQVGTTIRVLLNVNASSWFSMDGNYNEWDWFCLSTPSVIRSNSLVNRILKQRFNLPSANDGMPASWRRINHTDFQAIHWTFDDVHDLVCNGIKINDYNFYWHRSNVVELDYAVKMRRPSLSVFDPDGNLPLNLQRTDLKSKDFQFIDILVVDMIRDLLAFIIANTPVSSEWSDYYNVLKYPGFKLSYYNILRNPFLVTSHGICLATAVCLQRTKVASILFLPITKHSNSNLHFEVNEHQSEYIYILNNPIESRYEFVLEILQAPARKSKMFKGVKVKGARLLVTRTFAEYLNKRGRPNQELRKKIVEEWKTKQWVCWRIGDCPSVSYDFQTFLQKIDKGCEWSEMLAEWYLAEDQPKVEPTVLDEVWKQIIGEPVIPFDLQERHQKLAKAYETLKPYIEAHEAQAQEKVAQSVQTSDEQDEDE